MLWQEEEDLTLGTLVMQKSKPSQLEQEKYMLANRQMQTQMTGMPPVDEFGNPIDVQPNQGVNTGGMSGGSYQSVQSQLADRPIIGR